MDLSIEHRVARELTAHLVCAGLLLLLKLLLLLLHNSPDLGLVGTSLLQGFFFFLVRFAQLSKSPSLGLDVPRVPLNRLLDVIQLEQHAV